MKEIDLLPEWYKNSKRRQVNVHRQYVALGCIFVVMMAWNFITAHSVSKATARVTDLSSKQTKAQNDINEFSEIKNEVSQLKQKMNVLEKTDSRINVANVLAEIGFLIDESIALSKVEIKAEKFDSLSVEPQVLRRVLNVRQTPEIAAGDTTLLGDIRFKVVLNGIAADTSDAAELVCKLEDSPYFWQVYPSYSGNRNLGGAKTPVGIGRTSANSTEAGIQVSEFEISCYLANYSETIIDSSMLSK